MAAPRCLRPIQTPAPPGCASQSVPPRPASLLSCRECGISILRPGAPLRSPCSPHGAGSPRRCRLRSAGSCPRCCCRRWAPWTRARSHPPARAPGLARRGAVRRPPAPPRARHDDRDRLPLDVRQQHQRHARDAAGRSRAVGPLRLRGKRAARPAAAVGYCLRGDHRRHRDADRHGAEHPLSRNVQGAVPGSGADRLRRLGDRHAAAGGAVPLALLAGADPYRRPPCRLRVRRIGGLHARLSTCLCAARSRRG